MQQEQWIGLWENLQETMDFPMKYGGFLYFSLKPIRWTGTWLYVEGWLAPADPGPMGYGQIYGWCQELAAKKNQQMLGGCYPLVNFHITMENHHF